MPKLNHRHVEAVLSAINQGPYFKLLSMTVVELGMGYSIVEVEMGNKHLNPFGGVHGGLYASAIDTAAYWAVYCELDEDMGFTSIDLKVDYLVPAKEDKLIVKGRSIKIGRTICLAEATVFNEQNKCIAHGTSKMMVMSGFQTIKEAIDSISAQEPPPKFI
jgi:uncharacterized protein (TIGR00369 family)